MKKEEKEGKKGGKKGDRVKVEGKLFGMWVDGGWNVDLKGKMVVKFDEGVEDIERGGIEMGVKVEWVWEDIGFIVMGEWVGGGEYEIVGEWEGGEEYEVKIEWLCMKGI